MDDLERELEWAIKLHKADILDEASEKYREVLEVNPHHGEANFLLGIIE